MSEMQPNGRTTASELLWTIGMSCEQFADLLRHFRRAGFLIVNTEAPQSKLDAAQRLSKDLAQDWVLSPDAADEVGQLIFTSTWNTMPPSGVPTSADNSHDTRLLQSWDQGLETAALRIGT